MKRLKSAFPWLAFLILVGLSGCEDSPSPPETAAGESAVLEFLGSRSVDSSGLMEVTIGLSGGPVDLPHGTAIIFHLLDDAIGREIILFHTRLFEWKGEHSFRLDLSHYAGTREIEVSAANLSVYPTDTLSVRVPGPLACWLPYEHVSGKASIGKTVRGEILAGSGTFNRWDEEAGRFVNLPYPVPIATLQEFVVDHRNRVWSLINGGTYVPGRHRLQAWDLETGTVREYAVPEVGIPGLRDSGAPDYMSSLAVDSSGKVWGLWDNGNSTVGAFSFFDGDWDWRQEPYVKQLMIDAHDAQYLLVDNQVVSGGEPVAGMAGDRMYLDEKGAVKMLESGPCLTNPAGLRWCLSYEELQAIRGGDTLVTIPFHNQREEAVALDSRGRFIIAFPGRYCAADLAGWP
jgi:hypothetical protein